jgi:hypothetical protein
MTWTGTVVALGKRDATDKRKYWHVRFQEAPKQVYYMPADGENGTTLLQYASIMREGEVDNVALGLSPVVAEALNDSDVDEREAELRAYAAPIEPPVPRPTSKGSKPGQPTQSEVVDKKKDDSDDDMDPDDPKYYMDPKYWPELLENEYDVDRLYRTLREKYVEPLKSITEYYFAADVVRGLKEAMRFAITEPDAAKSKYWIKQNTRYLQRLMFNKARADGMSMESIQAVQRVIDKEGEPAFMTDLYAEAEIERKKNKKDKMMTRVK